MRGCDGKGCGSFGSGRDRDGVKGPHLGVDYVGKPGQDVVAVTGGLIGPHGHPNGKHLEFWYVRIFTPEGYVVKEMYVNPSPTLSVGDQVSAGDVIGTLQSLQGIYPGITDHVHVSVTNGNGPIDPSTLISP